MLIYRVILAIWYPYIYIHIDLKGITNISKDSHTLVQHIKDQNPLKSRVGRIQRLAGRGVGKDIDPLPDGGLHTN